MAVRARRIVTTLLVVLAVLYLALCVFARVSYPRVLFPAPALAEAPAEVTTMIARGDAEMLTLPQRDGRATKALFFAPRAEGARVVVMFHGNGETMFDRLDVASALGARGLGVALLEYRGYGITHGPPPSESEVYEDASGLLDELARRGFSRARIAIWGTSLGTAPAVEMARHDRAAALVLVTPFTSLVSMGRRLAPFLPSRILLAHRFDSRAKAPEIRCPTLVVHGAEDELVPFDMGQEMAGAIPRARFVGVPGGHHNDLFWGAREGAPSSEELFAMVVAHVSAE